MKMLQFFLVMIASMLAFVPAKGQDIEEEEKFYEPMKLSGPRFGFTYIGGDLGELMAENNINQYLTQFGWQFETRWFQTPSGFQGLIETIVLLSGFETEEPALSGSLLVGFRTRDGFEAGVGPNITTKNSDHAFVFAVGHTAKLDFVNIPINFAIVPSSDALKYTVLVGFNIRRR